MRENTNPFLKDSPERKALFEGSIVLEKNTNPFLHENDDHEKRSSAHACDSATIKKYKNNFSDCEGGFEGQSVQELEGYAVFKAEETTETVNNCLKIAVNMRDDAGNTLLSLQKQGDQITKTHLDLVDLDQNLTRGEKLLGSLGGLFSRTWKPKKSREIRGPHLSTAPTAIDHPSSLKSVLNPERWGKPRSPPNTQPDMGIHKVEVEQRKQEDALSEISNILGDLKIMAVDMGTEIQRQNRALGHMDEDVDELNVRVRGANIRGRRLLRK